MYKKISLMCIMIIVLASFTFTGCTLEKTDYNVENINLEELPHKIPDDLSSYIRTKDNIYGLIMGLDFVIAIFAILYIFKFLLVDNNLKSQQRLLMVFLNTLALGAAMISFDAAHFSGWFIHKYGQVKIPMYEILIYDIIGVLIILASFIVYKVLRRKNSKDGEKLIIETGSKKWNKIWND